MIRPSSLPALSQCPRFESGEARDFTLDGTLRHEALASMFAHEDMLLNPEWRDKLDDESIEGIEWALEYIKLHAPLRDHELNIERKMEIHDEGFNVVMTGTLDYQCGNHLFDIKWRRRDYIAQMAAYALMMIQETGWERVNVHILFMESKHAQCFHLTESECWGIINLAKAKAEDPNADPTPCDYCGWCAHTLTCKALNDRAQAIVNGRKDWELDQYHASEIKEPIELAKAIKIARAVSNWAKAVEHFATSFVLRGGEIPGFELKRKQGHREVTNLGEAFARCGLEQSAFLDCCSVNFGKLVEKRKIIHSVSKHVATKEVERMLGDCVERKSPSYTLTEI